MSLTIDLNSDLGEHPGTSHDEHIMPFISSCNIACGGHVGNADSVEQTVERAIKYEVAIGAHPAFPDQENFGRKVIEIENDELASSIYEQIMLVKSMAESNGKELHHVKPHGALYNLAAANGEISKLIIDVVKRIDSKLKLYGLSHSTTQTVAEDEGIPFVGEAFADRKYESDLSLKSRKFDDAVISAEEEVLRQVEHLVLHKQVHSNEEWHKVESQTICLHSDTDGAIHLAEKIYNHLVKKGVHIIPV